MTYKKLNSVLSIVDKIINKNVEKNNIVIDATLGNGYDTIKLLKKIGKNGRLYGFDIQSDAIERTLYNINKEGLNDHNFKLINESHDNMKNIEEEIDFIIYNLGYLPGGNKEITTQKSTTLESIRQGLNLLKKNGIMVVVVYHGHPEGKIEKKAIEDFLASLDQRKYNCLKSGFINQQNNPPILYIIEKNN